MFSPNKRSTAAIALLASITARSIDKTMGKELDKVEDKPALDKAICTEVVSTLKRKDK
jgi:hypothetical protein